MANIKETDHTKYQMDAEHLEVSYISSGNANGTVTLENSLLVFYKVNHTLSIQPSNTTPGSSVKNTENIWSCEDLYANVSRSFIHNSQNLELFKCLSTEEWINKVYCNHTMGYYSAIKKWTNYWYVQRHGWIVKALSQVKESNTRDYIQYDSIYMKL